MKILEKVGEPATNKSWVLQIWGSFSGDPEFLTATGYGRAWREAENRASLRRVRGGQRGRRSR